MTVGAGHVEAIDPAAAGEDIRSRWRDLAVARENPFLTPEWFDAWSEAGAGGEPWLLAWRREGGEAPSAVMPLRLTRGPVRTLRYPGPENGDWFGIACAAEDEADAAAALLAALRARSSEWDVLRLDRVPQSLPAMGLRRLRTDALPLLELGSGGYEDWLASRSRNFRSQLGRRRRRAERDHELALLDTPAAEGVAAAVDELFELHEARRRMQGTGGMLDERAQAAYRRFAGLCAERGWLRMHSLSLDGETAASWLGWRLGERYLYGISGFDPARESLAVGTVLLAHTIERAAAEGARVYDFLWGEESYKDRFATGRRTVVSLGGAAGLRGRLALSAARARTGLARSMPGGARERLRGLRSRAGRS